MGQGYSPGKKCKINVVKLLTPYVASVEYEVWGGGGPNRNGEKRMTNPANIQTVQAKQLKNGKYKFTAILEDGSQEIIKKAGAFKPVVNVYSVIVNGNSYENVGEHCTYNNKAGGRQLSYCETAGYSIYHSPIKSIEVELI